MTTEPLWSDEKIIDLLEKANERYGTVDGVDASVAEDLMIEMRDSYEAALAQRQPQRIPESVRTILEQICQISQLSPNPRDWEKADEITAYLNATPQPTPAAPPQPVAERMRQLLAEWQAEDEPNREQLLEMLRNMGAIAPPPMDAPDGETAP